MEPGEARARPPADLEGGAWAGPEPQFILYSLVEKHLDYCQCFAVKNTTMNNCSPMAFHTCVFLWRVFPEMTSVGSGHRSS